MLDDTRYVARYLPQDTRKVIDLGKPKGGSESAALREGLESKVRLLQNSRGTPPRSKARKVRQIGLGLATFVYCLPSSTPNHTEESLFTL